MALDVLARPTTLGGAEGEVGGLVLYVFDPAVGAARPARAGDLRGVQPAEVIIFPPVAHAIGGTLAPPPGVVWTRFYLFNADSAPVRLRVTSGAGDVTETTLASGGEYDEHGLHAAVEVDSAPVVHAAEGVRA